MQRILPIFVFIFGLIVLGFWAWLDHAPKIEAKVLEGAESVVAGKTRHGAEVTVSGRDVELFGVIHDQAEQDLLTAQLSKVTGRRVVRAGTVEILPIAEPYTATANKTASSLDVSTHLPDESAVSTLRDALPEAANFTPSLASGMPDLNWPTTLSLGLEGLGKLDEGSLSLNGRTLSLSGHAPSKAVATQMNELAARLPADYVLETDITHPAPYQFSLKKNAQDGVSITGALPRDMTISDVTTALNIGELNSDLAADAEGNSADILSELKTIGALLNGFQSADLEVSEGSFSFAGRANGPEIQSQVEALRASMPADRNAEFDVIYPQPYELSLNLDANSGASVSGTAPDGLANTDVAEALKLNTVGGEIENGALGDKDKLLEQVSGLSGTLNDFENLNVTLRDVGSELKGETKQRVDLADLDKDLTKIVPDLNVDLSTSSRIYEQGALRSNAITGVDEQYSNGYWLPSVSGFSATVETCQNRSAELLSEAKIEFVSGSNKLDNSARILIDRLAGLISFCVSTTNLSLELAGHTDSQGDEDANYRLSLARVEAVKSAFVDRGVPSERIDAIGFGETQPIADNETAEGRALNRRTEFNWINKN